MEVRGFNNKSPERPSARPQQQQTPLQTLIQLRKIEEDHASLQRQHLALRGLAADQATENEELGARNVSLATLLKQALANEKAQRLLTTDLGHQLAESHEQAQRRASDDALKHWTLSVELEQSQERARRADAGEKGAQRETDELREALATSDARLQMSERTSAFAASLERASNISAAAAAEGEVGYGGKRSRAPPAGEAGAAGAGTEPSSSSSMPLATDSPRPAAAPAAPAPAEETLFGPPLQPLLSRVSAAVAAATAAASVGSTPRSGSFKSSYLSIGSRNGSRVGSRRPSRELEDAGGAGATPSWSVGGSWTSLVP